MRRTVAAIGRLLVTLGLLILLFVTYELWGTGIFTARAQTHLKNEFRKELAQVHDDNPVVTVPPSSKPGHKQPKPKPVKINPRLLVAPPEGDPLGEITIKKIDVDWAIVEGVQLADLAKGPGHYPGTPLPGQIGDAAIAGHRTTHGAPFFRVNELAVGDKIVVRTLAGTYTYRVYHAPFAVQPTDYGVVANTPDAELTLTSCNPRYSAAQRIVIKAKLVKKLSSKTTRPPTRVDGKAVQATADEGTRDRSPGRVQQRHPGRDVGPRCARRRPVVVVGVPALAPPAHLGDRRRAVPRRAAAVLLLPGARAPERVLTARQLPLKSGVRFSANAAMPSCRSSLANAATSSAATSDARPATATAPRPRG